jgi:hypothetical protein
MAVLPTAIEFFERRPLEDFVVGKRKFSPKASINLQVDYEGGLWIISFPFLDVVGKSTDYFEAKKMLMDYIDFLWSAYVSSPREEMGETGKLLRETLQELFIAN